MPGDIESAAGPPCCAFVWMGLGALTKGPIAHRAIGHLSLLRRVATGAAEPGGLRPAGLADSRTHRPALVWAALSIRPVSSSLTAFSNNVQRRRHAGRDLRRQRAYHLISGALAAAALSGPFFRHCETCAMTAAPACVASCGSDGFMVLFFSLSAPTAAIMCCMASAAVHPHRGPSRHAAPGMAASCGAEPIAGRVSRPAVDLLGAVEFHRRATPTTAPSSDVRSSSPMPATTSARWPRCWYGSSVMLRWRQALWKRLVVAAALRVTVLAALVVPYAGALVQGRCATWRSSCAKWTGGRLKSFCRQHQRHRQAVTSARTGARWSRGYPHRPYSADGLRHLAIEVVSPWCAGTPE